jgi:hypothetical protein
LGPQGSPGTAGKACFAGRPAASAHHINGVFATDIMAFGRTAGGFAQKRAGMCCFARIPIAKPVPTFAEYACCLPDISA